MILSVKGISLWLIQVDCGLKFHKSCHKNLKKQPLQKNIK